MTTCLKETIRGLAGLVVAAGLVCLPAARLSAQAATSPAAPPPSTGGFFPMSQVHAGMTGTAWTVFQGTRPEPMGVEILGVLRNARGPGQDMILARLTGAKADYTGVVEGMSGSPVYIGSKLLGAVSYRIGQFSKEPIAGITPIQQMLEVRDLPIQGAQGAEVKQAAASGMDAEGMTFQAMDTPLVMSGFSPGAMQLWRKEMAGTSLSMVAAGGTGGSAETTPQQAAAARAQLVPGAAISAQLVRGDVEISATCTITYIDPKQLLACGHPILQAGQISLPMTTAEVVATLASPLNAFKIINTGQTVGAFTEDRDAAIRGVLGAKARMIPMHITVHGVGAPRKLNVEILDLPALTPQAMQVVLYNALLQTNQSTAETSYHLTGSIRIEGYPSAPVDLWATAGSMLAAPMQAAMLAGNEFSQLYANSTRQGSIRAIDLDVTAVPRRVDEQLENARLISGDSAHAGDTVVVEATVRPWQQPARNIRIPIKLPARLDEGTVRVLISDADTLARTLNPPRLFSRPQDMDAALAQARAIHPDDRIYVSLLLPDAQAGVGGETLSSLPLSMANALEPMRTAQNAVLNGESAVVAGDVPAGGVLSGFQVLNLHIEAGGGLQ